LSPWLSQFNAATLKIARISSGDDTSLGAGDNGDLAIELTN
jgi:hypothetical protein